MATLYKHKALKQGQIRLLELQPHLPGLICKLHHYNTTDAPPGEKSLIDHQIADNVPQYNALSHHWDPRPKSVEDYRILKIRDGDKDTEFQVRPRLKKALEAILDKVRLDPREEQWCRHLWIDAICIDQDNAEDKKMQLPIMGDIYNRARTVVVWLGTLDDFTEQGLKFVQQLQQLDFLKKGLTQPEYCCDWKSLAHLTRKDWFSRRWILQEIAAAREAVILAGDQSVSWDEFAGAVSLFISQFETVRSMLAKDGVWARERNFLGDLKLSGANILVEARSALLRMRNNGDIAERMRTLEFLMTSLSMFEVTEPHDVIYAILWLSRDASHGKRSIRDLSHTYQESTPTQSPIASPNTSDDEGGSVNDGSSALTREDLASQFQGIGSGVERKSYPVAIREQIQHVNAFRSDADLSKLNSSAANGINGLKQLDMQPRRVQSADAIPVIKSRLAEFSSGLIPTITVSSEAQIEEEQQADDSLPDNTGIKIDYTQPVYDLCEQVLLHILSTTKRLDIICFNWAPQPRKGDPKHPSWVMWKNRNTYAKPKEISGGSNMQMKVVRRLHADPLIGLPGSGQRPYLACGRTKAENVKIDNKVLRVVGYPLAKIGDVGGVAVNANIPYDWREKLEWLDSSENPPDCFWRTLVANRGPENCQGNPPARFKLACRWAFEGYDDDEAHMDLKERRQDGEVEPPLLEFLDKAISTTWNRRLFLTDKCLANEMNASRLVGLGPHDAQVGDYICVLWGCAVPVIMREFKTENLMPNGIPKKAVKNKDKRPPEKHFTLVGECYVDGFMNGECFHYADAHAIRKHTIYIH